MLCRYCGKEVPLHVRLTGGDPFCSPAHRKLYHEEHSRLGLERLLEDASASGRGGGPGSPQRPPASEADKDAVTVPAGPSLPAPDAVIDRRGVKLWRFPQLEAVSGPLLGGLARVELAPAAYTAGRKPAPAPVPRPEPARAPAIPMVAGTAGTARVAAAPPRDRTALPKTAPRREEPPAATPPAARDRTPAATVEFRFGIPAYDNPPRGGGSFSGRLKIAAAVLVAVGLGTFGYYGLGDNGGAPPVAVQERPPTPDPQDWIPKWGQSDQGEEIAVFGPSQEWSDYRVEWETEKGLGLAWVFRAIDPRNYYALQLERTPSGLLRATRYAVIGGVRSEPTEMPLAAASSLGEAFPVQLEVRGARFTLYLGGRNAAAWTDERLDGGGFGIIRPDMGRAGVNDLKVVRIQRESASTRSRYWTGTPADRLPEVRLLGGEQPSRAGVGGVPDEESSL